MDDIKSIADLIANPAKLQELLGWVNEMQRLRILTNTGGALLRRSPATKSFTLDTRGTEPGVLPAVAGQADKALFTDGVTTEWRFTGPTLYTELERVAVQSVPTATASFIAFDTALFNTGAVWSSGSPTKLTVPAGSTGLWQGFFWVFWDANATGQRQMGIRKNGSTFLFTDTRLPLTGNGTSVTLSFTVRLSAGDYIELYGYQESGVALNIVCQNATFMRIGS